MWCFTDITPFILFCVYYFRCQMYTKKDANSNGNVQRMMEVLPLSTTKWRRWIQSLGVGFLVVVQQNQVSDHLYIIRNLNMYVLQTYIKVINGVKHTIIQINVTSIFMSISCILYSVYRPSSRVILLV